MDKEAIYKKSNDLCNRLREHAISVIDNALVTNNLVKWFYGSNLKQLARNVGNFSWIYDLEGCENYSLDDVLESDLEIKNAKKRSKFVLERYSKLAGKPVEEDKSVKVTLKRNRIDSSWNYFVLSILPEGKRLWKDPDFEDENITKGNPAIIFSEVVPYCLNHACDILYKRLRDEGQLSGCIKYIEPEIIFKEICNQEGLVEEFMNPKTRETRDSETAVVKIVMGVYNNQTTYRIPIQFLK